MEKQRRLTASNLMFFFELSKENSGIMNNEIKKGDLFV